MNAPNGSAIILLFHTAAPVERAARLHSADCNMVNTAKTRGMRVVHLIDTDVEEAVADLEDRGFPCKRCKCCK